ncbi:MAG: DUF3362 domain-containing protein, partial [Alphaproteobacteria bacterium]|nr:DUF3362 domain-containing protein [Alphaproteobacteria bacterium]
WPLLREALRRMGRADLIGSRPDQLVPHHQPPGTGKAAGTRRPVRHAGKTSRFTTKGVRVIK